MNTLEAYDFTLEKIKELETHEIKVHFKESNSRNSKDCIKKYSGSERISPDKWYHVEMSFDNEFQLNKMIEMQRYLSMCGISFDTGGMSGFRDWELDWSFKYTEGKENWTHIDQIDVMEDIISQLSKDGIEKVLNNTKTIEGLTDDESFV